MRPFKSSFSPESLTAMQAGIMRYTYRDIACLKCPLDISIYLKLLWDLKPKTIIEIGSKKGGSALLFADIAQLFGLQTHIYSIDLNPPDLDDPRITFLQGDVNNLENLLVEYRLTERPHPWFVSEDSAHTFSGCSSALHAFAAKMTRGDILAIEDGILDELGLTERYDGGPNRAIEAFFSANPDVFELATDLCDMFGQNATYNPNAYLRKA